MLRSFESENSEDRYTSRSLKLGELTPSEITSNDPRPRQVGDATGNSCTQVSKYKLPIDKYKIEYDNTITNMYKRYSIKVPLFFTTSARNQKEVKARLRKLVEIMDKKTKPFELIDARINQGKIDKLIF